MCYYIPGFSLGDLRKTDSRELEWFYSRLAKQFIDEEEEYKKLQRGTR